MGSKLEAVESMMELGLTEYEARCFVALAQLSEGTAKEISRLADVPQSRVYDIADELHRMGVVDVQESEPREYYLLPVDRALDRFRREYDEAIETAARRLDELESRDTDPEGVWQIARQEDLVARLRMRVDDADEEVYLLLVKEGLLEEDVIAALREATDRDVSVLVEVPSAPVRDRLHDAVPGCGVAISDPPIAASFGDHEPGRLAMIDRETVLMSALAEGLVPGDTEEVGLWGTGADHGLVVWLRSFLERRLDRREFESA